MLKIITVPNPILRQTSKPVTRIDKSVLKFIHALEQTLARKTDPPGVGLSAIQTGKPLRIFSTYLPSEPITDRVSLSGKKLNLTTYINPKIIAQSRKLTLGGTLAKPFLEGCLSIPNIYGPVRRCAWIKLEWLSPAGQTHTAKFKDFPARVIQHELDHLNGILFTDRSLKDNQPLYEEKHGKLTPINLFDANLQ